MFATNPEISEQVRSIKATLRTMMNGPVSQAMRERGLTYKVNFGVELPRLKAWAEELPHSAALAARLWQEDIRECRLLAAMLQPSESFSPDLADEWIASMRFPEEAECTTMHLFAYMHEASNCAFRWIASPQCIYQQCGFILLGRLFMNGATLKPRDEAEYLDQTRAALIDPNMPVRLAAQKALLKYMETGHTQMQQGEMLLDEILA